MNFPSIGIALLLAVPLRAQVPLTTTLVAGGFERPLCVTHAPGDPTRLFVVEKAGRIRLVRNGSLLPTPFLDIASIVNSSTVEFGLLSACFDPGYATNGRFYVHFTAGTNGDSHIARFEVSADPDLADPATLATVLYLPQSTLHHRGGWLGFGPEGHLYAALGDGGPQEDPFNHAQDLALLHGKTVRLDLAGDEFPLDPDRNYRIPPTNPFVGQVGVAPEIWASGLRNPWRCSFDRETYDLWIGDVGEYEREELDVQPAGVGGLNYGWRCMEGTGCSPWGGCTCSDAALANPAHDYDHTLGRSVTCGYVYRGSAIPGLAGTFVYGDFVSGRFWSLRWDGSSVTQLVERTAQFDPAGAGTIARPASFGEDAQGEIYVCDYSDGEVYRIVPSNDAAPPTATILIPTDAPTWVTSGSVLALGGSASDDVEVTRVEWSNAAGASGMAVGTTKWSVPAIALVPGANAITVTAFDAIGTARATCSRSTASPHRSRPVPAMEPGRPVRAGTSVRPGTVAPTRSSRRARASPRPASRASPPTRCASRARACRTRRRPTSRARRRRTAGTARSSATASAARGER